MTNTAESIEWSGYSVILGLLNHFGKLLKLDKDAFNSLLSNDIDYVKSQHGAVDLEWRLVSRLSDRAKSCYDHSTKSGLAQEGVETTAPKDLKSITSLTEKYRVIFNRQLPDDVAEWWLRIQLILDHISGMTDAFALETYKMLNGIL